MKATGHIGRRGRTRAVPTGAGPARAPDDDDVCRCEGVTAGRILEAIAVGCQGPNQAKSFTRCSMGPWQGRMCGLTVIGTIAAALNANPQDLGGFRGRPQLEPLRLGELAALAQVS